MIRSSEPQPCVAIACGGTGGHLFPGIAVAEKLQEHGCDIVLIVSEKEIDKRALGGLHDFEVVSFPAVPLLSGNFTRFVRAFWASFLQARRFFKKRRPSAVLGMGGFTSAAPVLAGKFSGAMTCLHEANSFAGRANRLVAPWVDRVFIGYSSAAHQLQNRNVQFTGTPVRSQFTPGDPGAARMALGLKPEAPVLLVMGGSQGASAINRAVIDAIPKLLEAIPEIQFLHLTGTATYDEVASAYQGITNRAKVMPFLTEMELALDAASVTISRAGASSLAEIAAMRTPSILIPYPQAADDHQYTNARALAQQGAARLVLQNQLNSGILASAVTGILLDPTCALQMKAELAKWHFPEAPEQIARAILASIRKETKGSTAQAMLKVSLG